MMLAMMTAVLLAGSPVSLEFNGSLKDGLRELAQKSGINLVVIGELDERVQLNLTSADGAEALETIADAYGLEVKRSGKVTNGNVWVVRKGPTPTTPTTPTTATTPTTPTTPTTATTPSSSVESMQAEAEEARNAAEVARAEAEKLREKLESMKNVSQEARDQAREALQEAKEKAREAAEEAREKAQEAAELAREQAEEARQAARDQADAEREKADALREQAQAQAELHREMARHRVSTGGPVTVEKDTHVDTAVAYGGPVVVEENAVVDGDAVAFGGDVVLKKNAVVNGDAVSFGGNVVRDEGAVVHGETVSMGGSGIGSTVAHNVVKTKRVVQEDADDDSSFGRGLAGFLVQFAVFFGLGFVVMMFAPQRMKALEGTITSEPGKNALAGFLGLLASIPLTAALAVTIIGIPVAILMWLAAGLAVPVGFAAVANTLGMKLPTGRLRKTQALVLALGLLVLLLVTRIPVLGPILLSGALFVSLGAIIRTRFGQPPRGTPMIDTVQAAPVL